MTVLEDLVINFRKAIEAAKANGEPGELFRKFPVGQCGHVSDLLAQYLIDKGLSPITYVNGTYYGKNGDVMQAHTWLVVDDLIIDITGDQFKYHEVPLRNSVPIYIGPLNRFYQLFDTTHGSNHEHFGLVQQWFNYHELNAWYKTILTYIEEF